MMTGDYQLTSVAVARSIGMVPPGGRVVIILSRSESLNPKGALNLLSLPQPLPQLVLSRGNLKPRSPLWKGFLPGLAKD